MEKKKKFKILKRILPIICAVLCISTALLTPISAIVDSSQGTGTNYDITARSPYPMTVGLAFDTGDKNVVFATDIGGFGQEFNTTLNGADSFYWTSEASTADELDGTLTYQYLEVREQGKEYKNLFEPLVSDGYGLASYRPIKISVQSGTDLTQGLDCSSIVYRLQDVVINSSVIRKGNYTSNIHQDASAEAVKEDNIYSPNADDYRYLVPHVVLPTISDTSGYLGNYNVVANITDEWGNEWDLNYSIPVDTRGATSDTFVPFLPMSIFDSYGKSYGDEAYNIGMSNAVVLNEYYGYLDIDYYEYQNVIPDINLIVNLRAEVGGEDTIVKQEYLPLGEYAGDTFTEWIASVDGQNGYSFSAGAGPIIMTYTDTENDFIYSGTITDGNGANVYGSSVILDQEYRANLYREEAPTSDELAGTWVLNVDNVDISMLSKSTVFAVSGTFYSIQPDDIVPVALKYIKCTPTSILFSGGSSLTETGDIQAPYNQVSNQGISGSKYNVLSNYLNSSGQTLSYYYYKGTEEQKSKFVTVKIDSYDENADYTEALAWLKANATKQGATSLITFTIDGTIYQAEDGMTWLEWCNSSYNTDGYSTASNTIVITSSGTKAVYSSVGNSVDGDDVITSGHSYILAGFGGSNYSLRSDAPTTTATYEWVKVEGTEYGRSAMLTLPLWDTSNLIVDGRNYDLYSFPTVQKFIDGAKTQDAIPVPEVDYTSWIGTAVGGFLNMELMPNFSIGGVLAILIGFSIVMLFLKFFAGG